MDAKMAIVTGAAHGMGFHFARALAASEAAAVQDLAGAAEATRPSEGGAQADLPRGDIAAESNVARLAAVDRFGSIDILVNNAAIFTSLLPTAFEGAERRGMGPHHGGQRARAVPGLTRRGGPDTDSRRRAVSFRLRADA